MRSSRTVIAGRTLAVVATSVVALSLAGCTSDPEPTPMPTVSFEPTTSATTTASASPTTSSPSPSPSASATATASVPAGFTLDEASSPTFPDLGGNIGGIGVVRVGHHTGFDRVVWQFPGSGRPTYRVHYVDEPTADGSGDAVDGARRRLRRGDDHDRRHPVGRNQPRPRDASASSISGTVVAQALPVYGGFEGYGQTFVGVRDRERPFRVTVLREPDPAGRRHLLGLSRSAHVEVAVPRLGAVVGNPAHRRVEPVRSRR